MIMASLLRAALRLRALAYGDIAPKTWKQGDIDVTFTPFCKAVRAEFKDVVAIVASKDQNYIVVYTTKISVNEIEKAGLKLKAAQIPGNPRFRDISMSAHSDYRGTLAVRFNIYSGL